MSEYPRSQEEQYEGMLRGFLMYAERQIINSEKKHSWDERLDNYKRVKGVLNRAHELITHIQMDGMMNEYRKGLSLKVIKALTELTKTKGDVFLKDLIMN